MSCFKPINMKWLILVVASLIQSNQISCGSNEIFITPDCASGESAWCASLGSASECKATDYCFQNVWSKDWQHVGKEKNCVMCQKMMDEVKSSLEVNESGASAVVSLIDNDKVCSMAQLCEVEKDAEHGLDDFVVARRKVIRKAAHHLNKWTRRAPYCDLCHSVFNAIANFIDHHQNMIQQLLHTLCGLFGHAFEDTCNHYSSTYGPIGVSIISSYLHHQICSSIHICASKNHANINIFTQTTNNIFKLECAACNDAMALIHMKLSEENAIDDFKSFVTKECVKYEDKEAGCIALLHGQADALHGLLLKNISENDSCVKNCMT